MGKFNETLPEKKDLYSHLNMEDIIDADYTHAKRVCKDFETKHLGKYDLYVQSNVTLLLGTVFENFRYVLKYMNLILQFFSAPGLAWQAALKNTKVKLDLLTDTDMLLMLERGIRGGICQDIYRYAKGNNKYMKDYDKNKESSYNQYWGVNKSYGSEISQKLPINNFEWIKYTSQFTEDFIKKL